MTDIKGLIDDEIFAIHQGGEMPEVALHTSLYYLQEDPEGPRIEVAPQDIQRLKEAVANRYKRIVMRDLNPRYRDRLIYRGLARAMANWDRWVRFGEGENQDMTDHRQDVAQVLLEFLAIETTDVASGRQPASVNCSATELVTFAESLGLAPSRLPEGWQAVCVS